MNLTGMQVVITEEEDDKRSKSQLVVLRSSQAKPSIHNPKNIQNNRRISQVDVNIMKYSKNSLFIFGEQNPFRLKVMWLTEHKIFEILIVITIIINTIILALQDYRLRLNDSSSVTWRNNIITSTETLFSSIYIGEFALKVISQGFVFEKCSYLRDHWNKLDFIIVCSSIINLLPIPIVFMGVKVLRVLRPLRSINSIKGLKILMGSLLDSLPALGNVVLFLLFTIVLFSIVGLQLFNGIFSQRCRTISKPINNVWPIDENVKTLCGISDCPSYDYCGDSVQEGMWFSTSELQSTDYFYGMATFDNLFWAFLTVFQSLTTEGWSSILYLMITAYTPIYVYFYFIFLILVGSFFLINLILAVINDSFVKQQEEMNSQGSASSPMQNSSSMESLEDEDMREDNKMGMNGITNQNIPQIQTDDNGNGNDKNEEHRSFSKKKTMTSNNDIMKTLNINTVNKLEIVSTQKFRASQVHLQQNYSQYLNLY